MKLCIKSILYGWLPVAAFLLFSTGCTRNNGDIGDFFGSWQLENIETDGTPDADYQRNIFWLFQNDVLMMILRPTDTPTEAYTTAMGTWNEENGYLFVDFSHHAENPDSQPDLYIPFEETHIPTGMVSALHIDSLGSGKMTLTFVSPVDGKTYRYTLSKMG